MANLAGIMQLYTAYFNRAADKAGIDYWSGKLSSGNISVSQLVQAIVNAAVEKDGSGNYKNGTVAISLSSISIDNSSIDSIKSIAIAFIDDSSIPQIEHIELLSDSIVITFNESIQFTGEGYTFGIWYADGSPYGNSTLEIIDNALIIIPDAGMVKGTEYMIYAKDNVVENLSGNNFNGIAPGEMIFIA